jgi:hypothetical protein
VRYLQLILKGSRVQGFEDSSDPQEEKYGLTSQGCFIYLNGSVCELETQILSAGDLDLIEKGVLGKQKKDIADESGAKFEH